MIARHHFLDSTEKVINTAVPFKNQPRYLDKIFPLKVFDSGTGYITVLPLIWPQGRSVEELREVYWIHGERILLADYDVQMMIYK